MSSTPRPANTFCGRTRREFLWQAGGGFTGVALAGLLSEDGFFDTAASAAAAPRTAGQPTSGASAVTGATSKRPHFPAKATNVIFLFMYGGPSQVDTFDYKPKLYELDGQTIPVKTFGRGGKKNEGRVIGPKWKFKQYGQCGKYVSDLMPHVAECVDDIAFIHSMTADSPIHGSAMLQMNTGKILSGAPCVGSWVNYGLGSANQNMPGFCVMLDSLGGPISGAKNWTSGYMPASYQGTILRSSGAPILDLARPEGMTDASQRRLLDTLKAYNTDTEARHPGYSELSSRVASYEMAYRMQSYAPEAVDLANESPRTLALYGIDNKETEEFGRKCLLARRLVERGVRFIQLYAGGGHNDDTWDAHGDLERNHNFHAGRTDKAIAGLLKDLKQRGLLDTTLVVWGGEFGRQPTAEYAKGTGRDHNAYGFTMWMAGGGIKGGTTVGETDELGSAAITDRFHVKNLHATILHQLGIDPNRLSYFFNGLDQKLVGVEAVEPIQQVIS